jgi:hypothetical protein
MSLQGIGPSGAARLLAEAAGITRFPDRDHFASWNGTAPIDASSGDHVRHRLSRAGNRQINRVLHIMAVGLSGLLVPALGGLALLLLAGLGCCLPVLLPCLLGGQPLRFRCRLLAGMLGLLLFPELGLGRAFLLPPQLRSLFFHLSRDPAFFGGPRPGGLFFQLLLLQLGLLAGLIHLGE